MSVQKFIVSKQSNNYTTFLNKVMQGIKSYAAKGLYAYLISLPPGWEFHKNQLAEHGGIGRDKINKLLKILEAHNLIEIRQVRAHSGQFAHFDMHVKDGTEFKEINDLSKLSTKSAQPFTEKPLTANQLLVNSSYKEYKNKEYKKHKEYISCASDDAHSLAFEELWKIYPKKKDKKRAKDKYIKIPLDQLPLIFEKVQQQIKSDAQWNDVKFVPELKNYLNNERWKDEIVVSSPKQSKPNQETRNEPRSTVKEYGPGHPTWEMLHGKGSLNEQPQGKRDNCSQSRSNGLRKAENYLFS